jgi:adenine-specific DNA-methyltransferase
MPKKKPVIDALKLNQIGAYTYPEYGRANIPPVGMAQYDTAASPEAKYEYDPHIDPSLQWAGKAEGASFEVPTSSIHVHEVIRPHKIIRSARMTGDGHAEEQGWLFESDMERAKRRNDAIEFYQHKNKWTNRLIAGDSLVIMNSMLEKEGMAGQVQMVYIDPPYGIKYGSNFQPFVNKRDVKDKKDEDLTTEPEMIKAFRDTWELGIHSYLTYLRDRLLLARELLSDSGSVFVQISDENVHHVREICDEVFGANNFISLITVKKTAAQTDKYISSSCDYIIWYAKNKNVTKYHQIYFPKDEDSPLASQYRWVEFEDGTRKLKTEINSSEEKQPFRLWRPDNLTSSHDYSLGKIPVEYEGKKYLPGPRHWTTSPDGFQRLKNTNRLCAVGNTLSYVRYLDDFPVSPLLNVWTDTGTGGYGDTRYYVVQTTQKVIQRCLLMTTDPGDLVLDITCGSGTTAYVAEQLGRRWITCDTSRIAITLTKKRLMTATFDFYKIKDITTNHTNGREQDFEHQVRERGCLRSNFW